MTAITAPLFAFLLGLCSAFALYFLLGPVIRKVLGTLFPRPTVHDQYALLHRLNRDGEEIRAMIPLVPDERVDVRERLHELASDCDTLYQELNQTMRKEK